MLHFVVTLPSSFQVCDNFSVFPCFSRPWNCWQILARCFEEYPFSDGFLIVRLGLWVTGKNTTEAKCLYYAMNVASHLILNLRPLSKVVFTSVFLVKLFSTLFISLYSSFWRQFMKWVFGFTSYKGRDIDLNYLHCFHKEDLCFLSHSFAYLILYLYKYKHMDTCFILWVITKSVLFIFTQIIPALAIGPSFRLAA